MKYQMFICLVLTIGLGACDNKPKEKNATPTPKEDIHTEEEVTTEFEIVEFSDEDYPDNPDIGFRSTAYSHDYFTTGEVLANEENDLFDLYFYTSMTHGDTLALLDISLDEFMPAIPNCVKGKDDYLSYIAVVNQEWNRNQVKFDQGQFYSSDEAIVRMDLARNCLNSYLWEIILYETQADKEVPIYHGWFDFPKGLYHQLFEKVNGQPFEDFQHALVDWVDPESKKINRDLLRTITAQKEVSFEDKSNAMYPLKGAREKKFKEIIYPAKFQTMRDLQKDSTLFATFSQPGYYNREDPRKTELGRIYQLDKVTVASCTSDGEQNMEIDMYFTDRNGVRKTHFVLGGLNGEDFPTLTEEEANSGWKNSMGFGNHTFYESYEEHTAIDAKNNPYYGFLSNEKDEWLDSHAIGIDGPIIHWDEADSNLLHIWLLSFERHALVGHYILAVE